MESYTRTDLAFESFGDAGKRVEGAEQSMHRSGNCRIHRLRIRTADAASVLGKPIGSYVTVECGKIHHLNREKSELLAHILSGELRGMTEVLTGRKPDPDFSVFVTGLGNAELTADALGPDTVSKLTATRHLREHELPLYREIGCSALSAFAPGVLGQTGIEALELLRGAVRSVKPDLVVAVDALAARSCKRLASTVQLSNAGIVPGSGVGNHRTAITADTLGVPVIALGVPMVVDSSTLVYDALQEAHIDDISDSLREVLENGRSFFVSPKESDVITEQVSDLLARAISMAFVGDFQL